MPFRLPRRAFIRGLAGTALALPTLEAALDGNGTSYAQDGAGLPKRFMSAYTNISAGSNDWRSRSVRTLPEEEPNLLRPDRTGFGYDLKLATMPFGPIQDEVTIVSGLQIGHSRYNGGVVPRAGVGMTFHSAGMKIMQYCGESRTAPRWEEPVRNPSVDHFIVPAIAGDTPHPRLAYSIEPLSWQQNFIFRLRDDGRIGGVTPESSPQQAWQTLMSSYVSPDAAEDPAILWEREKRRSVLDLVASERTRLLPRLSTSDRRRLDQHFTEVRQIERRLASLSTSDAEACVPVDDPGADSDVRHERTEVLFDLMFMAFACDLSRVIMFQFGGGNTSLEPVTGEASTLHEVTHNNGPEGAGTKNERLGHYFAWQNGFHARFFERLRDTPEGEGDLLSNLAFTAFWEGGRGRSMDNDASDSAHSGDNMIALVAGRAGGLVPGQHIATDGVHPGCVNVSAMRALGVSADLGELRADEYIPELFGA